MIIRSKAPLRLGFAGGGTDVSPFCDKYGGCVLNSTISLYSYCTIIPNDSGKIEFYASDLGIKEEYVSCLVLDTSDGLRLHKGIYNRIVKDYAFKKLSFKMITYSDAKPGSGLGTSSTMVVAIVKAFLEWLKIDLNQYELAKLAYDIERIDLGLSGGRQDQYAAVFGGLNYIEFFNQDRVVVNQLKLNESIKNELEGSLVLYYLGISHDSSKIIDDQKESLKNQVSLNAMLNIKNETDKMKEYILKGDFFGVCKSLDKNWDLKKQTSNVISNSRIDSVYNYVLKHGGISAKISGAGGGGVMMILCLPEKRYDLMKSLKKLGEGTVFSVSFVEDGVKSWTR